MSEDEIRAAVNEMIKAENGTGLTDMGRLMCALKAKYAGRMDFAKASAVTKELLA